jgi:1D-myo-inositol-tetrakisphosphate 5-kinase/inositol-polyphosphate multikinase
MEASSKNPLPQLPPDTKPLEHQIAGHIYGQSKTKYGLLQRCSTGDVLKPLIDSRRGPREQHFYLNIFSDEGPEKLRALRPFIPTLLGTYEYNGMNYLILENVVQPFDHPCTTDIKIGRITYDCEASEEKIKRCNRKYPPTAEIGFQLLGWKIYCPIDNHYEYYDKVCGRKLTKEEVIHAIAHFYGAPKSDYRKTARLVLERLTDLEHVIAKQYGLVLIAASLLIVYEGSEPAKANGENHGKKIDVRIVDFAHAFMREENANGGQPDENFLFGLRSYMNHLQRLIDDTYVYVPINQLNDDIH